VSRVARPYFFVPSSDCRIVSETCSASRLFHDLIDFVIYNLSLHVQMRTSCQLDAIDGRKDYSLLIPNE
jgi:hypothetical protein